MLGQQTVATGLWDLKSLRFVDFDSSASGSEARLAEVGGAVGRVADDRGGKSCAGIKVCSS